MPKPRNNMKPRKNATEERLRATPFNEVETMDLEESTIRLSVWRKFTESKIIEELLTKPEFSHVKEELKAGLSCSLHGSRKDQVYRIFSDGKGMKLEVNKKFAEALGDHQIKFFQGVVQAGIEGYGTVYMQMKGLLNRPNVSSGQYDSKGKETKK